MLVDVHNCMTGVKADVEGSTCRLTPAFDTSSHAVEVLMAILVESSVQLLAGERYLSSVTEPAFQGGGVPTSPAAKSEPVPRHTSQGSSSLSSRGQRRRPDRCTGRQGSVPSQIRKLGVEGMGRAVLILKVGELNGCRLLCFEEFQVKEMEKRGHSIGQVQRNSDTLEQCMGKGKQIGWSVPAGWPRDVKR